MKALLLAAGFGSRLMPYTSSLPKCLMPINGKPLLEFWLEEAARLGCSNVLVNTHYLRDQVSRFLSRKHLKGRVQECYEVELLGTAGTIRRNSHDLVDSTVLLAHADNLCLCDFEDFLDFHKHRRPRGTVMTMMTFETDSPQNCGIVKQDEDGVVVAFHEKVNRPPGNVANAAVYLLEPDVVEWIRDNPNVTDFSTEVIANFIGKIATWHNSEINVDIGTVENLFKANLLSRGRTSDVFVDDWWTWFSKHKIHQQLNDFKPMGADNVG